MATGTASNISTGIKNLSILQPATDLIAARRRWEYRMLRRCATPAPKFGSAEWLALPEGDVRKVGAVVAAAASWARDQDELPERLALEVAEMRRSSKELEDFQYVTRYRAHRAEWSRRTTTKTFVKRRAAQLEAATEPRPGDFKGRGSA